MNPQIEDENLKVSVIIPVYNAEKYLARCLKAVLEQTYKDLEIILINDGSEDGSGDIIRSFDDERIVVIEKENGGVSAARNDGLRRVSGTHVVFVDADDYPEPDYVEKMADAMDRRGCGLVVCGYRYRDVEDHETGGFPNKREALHLSGDGSIAIGEDLLFLIEYVSKCDAFYLVAAPLYNYLINPGGAMKTIMGKSEFEPKWLSEWESICRAEEYYPAPSRMIRDVFEYKKVLIANKILTKAAKCGFKGPECAEMKDYIKKNRIRAIRNPYLKARVKAKAFSY